MEIGIDSFADKREGSDSVKAINNVIDRIIFADEVEAGEKLGFLPGDLSQKVDPYLRPLYDALYEMLVLI